MTSENPSIVRTFGPLRFALIALVIIVLILRPDPGTKLAFEGLEIISTLLAPVLSPILFMLLLLDAIMAMVYRSDKVAELRSHYLVIVLTDLGLAVLHLLYWLPFYKSLSTV